MERLLRFRADPEFVVLILGSRSILLISSPLSYFAYLSLSPAFHHPQVSLQIYPATNSVEFDFCLPSELQYWPIGASFHFIGR